MSKFFTRDELIIDPHYGNVENYALHFDYDLLGRRVVWYARILDNPLLYLRRWLVHSRFTISFAIIWTIIIYFLILHLADYVFVVGHFFVNLFYTKWRLTAEKREFAKHQKFLAREDPDRYAAIYCQAAASHHGVCSIFSPVPKDLPDYEAVRFVFEEPWLVDKTHRALYQMNETELWGELAEGELEDAIRLATEEKRLRRRVPLSFSARIAARQELTKKEIPIAPKPPSLSPEMKLLLNWERLFKERVQESVEESYQWWLHQNKTLPVESREVTEKMKPILSKVAEAKKNKTPDILPIDLFREMRMSGRVSFKKTSHEESASKRSQRKDRSSSLKPDLEKLVVEPQQIVDESQFVQNLIQHEPARAARTRGTHHKPHGKRKRTRSDPAKRQ